MQSLDIKAGLFTVQHNGLKCGPWKPIKTVKKGSQAEEETGRGQGGQTLRQRTPEQRAVPGLSLASALQKHKSTLQRIMKWEKICQGQLAESLHTIVSMCQRVCQRQLELCLHIFSACNQSINLRLSPSNCVVIYLKYVAN